MTKKTGPLEAHAPTSAQWTTRWEAAGQAAFAAGRSCQFDPDVLAATVAALATIPALDPQVSALLARKGVDHAFFQGLAPLGVKLKGLLQGQSPDRRRFSALSPDDKRTTDAAYDALSFARNIAGAAANAVDRTADVRVLGRGVRVSRSPASVRDGIQLFVANYDSCKEILADGGFGAEELASLQAFLPQLEAILATKSQREKSRDASSDELDALGLGVESALHLFRARATVALSGQPVLLARTLAHLPRRPERRTKAEEGGGTGEGSGAGTTEGKTDKQAAPK